MRPSITLCVIAKNEVHNLDRLFYSVRDCFDEIHFTDTGSTDGTKEKASLLGAKTFDFPWVNDFAAARNASIEHVKTDFWAWLDCDDELSSPEKFIYWRDHAMNFGDFWLATYNYAFANGKPVCTFGRERVFRTKLGHKWKYFVHEGVIPNPTARQNYAISWAVNHCRTEKDRAQDESRNLTMFEARKDELDARMKFYYGKELFENKRPLEAYAALIEATKSKDLIGHDRILAMQYAALSAMAIEQWSEAEKLAHLGLQLDPNRAEFYVMLGDMFIKTGRLKESVPVYHAARNCINLTPTDAKYQGPIFTTPIYYGQYPSEQLIRVFSTQNDFITASKICDEALEKYPNPTLQTMKSELEKQKAKILPKAKKHVRELVISCPPSGVYEWDWDVYQEKGMGGSETAAIEIAHNISRLYDMPVKIFNMRKEAKKVGLVEYLPAMTALDYMSNHIPTATLLWRHIQRLNESPSFVWCHDLITIGAHGHHAYDKIIALSEFHKTYIKAMQDIPDEKIIVARNGIDVSKYRGEKVKDPRKVVFVSSPDRGLEECMLILDDVVKKHPRIQLHVFYGFENLYKSGLSEMADRLKKMIEDRPWVKYHGFTEQKKLAAELMTASYWLHPANFIETSCISAMEMMAASVYPITRNLGALPETLGPAVSRGMATIIDDDPRENKKVWVDAFNDAYENQKHVKMDIPVQNLSWAEVAKEFAVFLGLMAK